MIKEVFFIRHSKPGKCCPLYKWFSLQKQNEKKRLTNEGKLLAEKAFQDEMFKNIEEIYSSNYLRTYQTAKILSRKYGIKVKVNKMSILVILRYANLKIIIINYQMVNLCMK